jgi:cyclopropane fatty-acyl-phospholipid synthase-like methyltransferase
MSSYDEVPYSSYPYARTQPDRLCTLGRLFGLVPAEPSQCRVLELGCASGGNLVPMAERAPESRFVGVDLSARQIADGQRMIDALGLSNVELRHGDIAAVDASWGEFDYVICHGVYSWVPPHVQERILAICSEQLAPRGIGYVSYNTYPGWHVR